MIALCIEIVPDITVFRKEGRKEERKKERKKGRKEGRKGEMNEKISTA